jgi:HEAT repeat protein
MMRTLLIFSILGALLPAAPLPVPPTPAENAWLILQQGLTSNRAEKRANAVRALRLLPHNPRAQKMAESALTDPSPKVRAAAARALGPMGAVSSVPNLKGVLNDREPIVVLAAAHSLFLLGDREEVYDIDYQVLIGERKSADGFVQSQMNELHDPKAVALMGFETGIGFMPFGGEAYDAFKRISKDDRTPVRAAAAKELATDRDPKIDAALARACSDKKWPVRAAAVDAIAKRDNPALLSAITPALDDKSDIVRYDASATVLRLSGEKLQTIPDAIRTSVSTYSPRQ